MAVLAAHGAHARTAAAYPKCGIGTRLRVHASQKSSPHPRQWWRRRMVVKGSWQPRHARALESAAQRGCGDAPEVGVSTACGVRCGDAGSSGAACHIRK